MKPREARIQFSSRLSLNSNFNIITSSPSLEGKKRRMSQPKQFHAVRRPGSQETAASELLQQSLKGLTVHDLNLNQILQSGKKKNYVQKDPDSP